MSPALPLLQFAALLAPGLTAGQIGRAALQIAGLIVAQFLLLRLQRRWRRLSAECTGPSRRFYALLLSVYPRLSIWMWVVGLYTAAAWHLGPALGVAQTWEEQYWGRRFIVAVSIVAGLSLLGRWVWIGNQRLRTYAAGDGARWQSIAAVLVADLLQIGIPLLSLHVLIPLLDFTPVWDTALRYATNVFLIAAAGWIAGRMVNLVAIRVAKRHEQLPPEETYRARPLLTQVALLRRMGLVFIAFLTLSCILILFAPVRQFGASLLASAGVLGVIAGIAAQRTLANLLAGFQIALTRPILIDDAVLVEGEYGDVEEITLTYVVVRLWDLRRMVLPISYFLEKPFQNWSRRSREILGTVFLSVDYSVPLDELRAEFERIVEAQPLWNKRVKKMQITEARERSLEVRFLMTADTPSRTFDLRCEVREALVRFLRTRYPQALPARVHTEVEPLPALAADFPSSVETILRGGGSGAAESAN